LWEFVMELAVQWKKDEKLQDSRYRKARIPCLTALSSCIWDEAYIHSSHSGPKNWSDDYALPPIALISTGKRLIILHARGCSGSFPCVIVMFKCNHETLNCHNEINGKYLDRLLNA